LEVLDKKGKIINKNGQDMSQHFITGAQKSLKILQENNVTLYV
jgi:uncharacterized protein YbbK (DUF523 family)